MEIENLKLQNEIDNFTEIDVSSTEPVDKKKLWAKQSKNLFNFRDLETARFGVGTLSIKNNVFTITGTTGNGWKDGPVLQDYLINYDEIKSILNETKAVPRFFPVEEGGFNGLDNEAITIEWWTETDTSASRTLLDSERAMDFDHFNLNGKSRLEWTLPSGTDSVQFTIQVTLEGEDSSTYENPNDIEKDTFVRVGNGYSSILQGSVLEKGILDVFYPIGSYYETSDSSFDPNVSWGGTWEKMHDGTALISEGAYWNTTQAQPGETIGNVQTWLNINQVPSHTHSVNITTGSSGSHNHTYSGTTNNTTHSHNLYHSGRMLYWDSGLPDSPGKLAFGTDDNTGTNIQLTWDTKTATDGSHSHTYSGTVTSGGSHTHSVSGTTGSAGQSSPSPVNLYQPSLVICRWHRTA